MALEITSIAKLAIQSLAQAVAGIEIQEQKVEAVLKTETLTPLDSKIPTDTAVKAIGDTTLQLAKPSAERRPQQGQKRKFSRNIKAVKAEEFTLQDEDEDEEEEEDESDENTDHSDSDGEFGSPMKRRQSSSKESAKPVKVIKAGMSEYGTSLRYGSPQYQSSIDTVLTTFYSYRARATGKYQKEPGDAPVLAAPINHCRNPSRDP